MQIIERAAIVIPVFRAQNLAGLNEHTGAGGVKARERDCLLLRGSGHINLGLGMVMTLQGVGAAFSATWGGIVAARYGYSMAFLALALAPCMALVLLLAGTRLLPRLRASLTRQEVRERLA